MKIAASITAAVLAIALAYWLSIPSVHSGILESKRWQHSIEVQRLGSPLETTVRSRASAGVIVKQWSKVELVPAVDLEGNAKLELETVTHYLYRPWLTITTVIAAGSHAKLPTDPDSSPWPSDFEHRRLPTREYVWTVGDREFTIPDLSRWN